MNGEETDNCEPPNGGERMNGVSCVRSGLFCCFDAALRALHSQGVPTFWSRLKTTNYKRIENVNVKLYTHHSVYSITRAGAPSK